METSAKTDDIYPDPNCTDADKLRKYANVDFKSPYADKVPHFNSKVDIVRNIKYFTEALACISHVHDTVRKMGKYPFHVWENNPIPADINLNSACRHVIQFGSGLEYDVDGPPHVYFIVCRTHMFLTTTYREFFDTKTHKDPDSADKVTELLETYMPDYNNKYTTSIKYYKQPDNSKNDRELVNIPSINHLISPELLISISKFDPKLDELSDQELFFVLENCGIVLSTNNILTDIKAHVKDLLNEITPMDMFFYAGALLCRRYCINGQVHINGIA